MADVNEVWCTAEGGILYQGDCTDLFDALADVTLWVNVCARELGGGDPQRTYTVAMEDAWLEPLMQERLRRLLKPMVESCARKLQRGCRVVSICNMGKNRSGLMNGLILRELGLSGDAAVNAVRRARGEKALSNEAFAAMVRE